MYLSNAVLGEFLAKCLFGKNWESMLKYVIPRKGNFVNPSLITGTDTYAIYYIEKKKKRVVSYQNTEYFEDKAVTTHYADIESVVRIQFIGKQAEEWASSILFWDERIDIQKLFVEYQSYLLMGEREIFTVPFQQDGYNGEMSYVGSFSVITHVTKEELLEYLTCQINLEGKLNYEVQNE